MILKHLGHNRKKEHGFTLVELLVAMTMAAVVMGAVYSLYKSQQKSYIAQDQVVEMQQNIRASFYQLARDLRMAGFNPQRAPNVGGFVTQLPDDGSGTTTTDDEYISFTIDQNQNGVIDVDDDDEQIAYRLDTNRLEKFRVNDDTWQTVADNIDDIDFVYLDPDGTDITVQVAGSPTTLYASTNLPYIDSIRSIEISITARTKTKDRDLKDYRRRTLTTSIFCRNLGL